MDKNKQALYIGLMSGTSCDGIDAVLVDLQNRARVIHHLYQPFDHETQTQINHVITEKNVSLTNIGSLDAKLGELYSKSVLKLLQQSQRQAQDIIAIGSHGQTICHQPDLPLAFSWQIGDPHRLAARTQITVIGDFRRRDIAWGGQGAPLAPAFHQFLFGHKAPCWLVNIGGMANASHIDNANITTCGFDTGPGNTLLDLWCQLKLNKPYDNEGSWARQGTCHIPLLNNMLADPYFQKAPPKSTGREYFHKAWLEKQLAAFTNIKAVDIQCTLVELTAHSIALGIKEQGYDSCPVFICGGGAYNQYLCERLQTLFVNSPIKTTHDLGIDPQHIEAIGFAWLAKQCLNQNPANIPAVTGAAQSCLLGAIYPVKHHKIS